MRFSAKAGTAAVALMLALGGIALADCPSAVGQRVILASDGMNPEVFVWDSHNRLVDYLGGHWSTTKDVMAHSMLVSPGTLAQVLSCRSHDARARYEVDAVDVYGVKLLTGPHRSRYGWIVGSDAHPQGTASAR